MAGQVCIDCFKWLCFHVMLLLLFSKPHLASCSIFVKNLPGFPGSLPFRLETGYIGVDETDDVQLFYYFVESERSPRDDPLVLWLTGGPGCSALCGLAFEIGPIKFKMVEFNGILPTLVPNPYSWTKVSSMIFVDAPSGTGFSYSRSSRYWSSDVLFANHLYSFLKKWLLSHPEFISNPIYLGGDSYSGIIIPVVAQDIAKGIEVRDIPTINFKGYLLGNPSTDTSFDENSRVPFAHRLALIPDELYKSAKRSCRGQYGETNRRTKQCSEDLQSISALIEKINLGLVLDQCPASFVANSRMEEHHKILLERPGEHSPNKPNLSHLRLGPKFQEPPKYGCKNYENFLLHIWANDVNVQMALGIEKKMMWIRCNRSSMPYTYSLDSVVSYHLSLNARGYRALIYSGDHDMIMPYLGTLAWIKSLNFTIVAPWRPWLVDDQVSGYTTEYANNFAFATVKGGGHTAPEERPKECFAMFKRWISEEPL